LIISCCIHPNGVQTGKIDEILLFDGGNGGGEKGLEELRKSDGRVRVMGRECKTNENAYLSGSFDRSWRRRVSSTGRLANFFFCLLISIIFLSVYLGIS